MAGLAVRVLFGHLHLESAKTFATMDVRVRNAATCYGPDSTLDFCYCVRGSNYVSWVSFDVLWSR